MRSSLTYWVRVKERMGIGGGRNNLVNSGYSSILGGHDNRVSGGNGVIAGGYNNVVTGANSAILGGSGNNDNGLAYAGIFGQNITGQAANMFHVDNLWISPMIPIVLPAAPPPPLPFPFGGVYARNLGVGNCALYIK